MPSDTMPQGSVVGQKYMTPPVSGQMLFPNQASRPGDSTPQRITPQPYGAYPSALPGSYGLPVQAPNGLSSTLLPPGNLPGNGFNRSSSAPTNVFQTNGPQSAPSGMPFGPRPPSSGPGVQQSPYTVGYLKTVLFTIVVCLSYGKVTIHFVISSLSVLLHIVCLISWIYWAMELRPVRCCFASIYLMRRWKQALDFL